MATVTAYTAERTKEIEDSAIVGGVIAGDNLILTRFDGGTIDAGDVRGPQGPIGSSSDTAVVVCTSGTRPALPYAGLIIYETDTDLFYKWNGTAWVYFGGTILCTSGTRPSSPFTGMRIYETNTKRPYTYNGTVWVYEGGVFLCTEATRPSSPFNGLSIYETDTNRTYTWNGTLWVPKTAEMRCKVNRNAIQAIVTATITDVIWTTQEYDTDGIWTPGGTANEFIIPANGAGSWRFVFNACFSANATGARHLGISKNGANIASFNAGGSAAWFTGGSVVVDEEVDAADIIKAYAYHTAGVDVNLLTTYALSFSAVKLS